MKKFIFLFITFGLLIGFGSWMASKNNLSSTTAVVKNVTDSAGTQDSNAINFVMPEYDERAIQMQRQEQMFAQMTPAQRAEYQKLYIEQMKQMQMQEEYLRQKAAYEAELRKNGGRPATSLTQQSKNRIEELKRQFEEQNTKQDTSSNSK